MHIPFRQLFGVHCLVFSLTEAPVYIGRVSFLDGYHSWLFLFDLQRRVADVNFHTLL